MSGALLPAASRTAVLSAGRGVIGHAVGKAVADIGTAVAVADPSREYAVKTSGDIGGIDVTDPQSPGRHRFLAPGAVDFVTDGTLPVGVGLSVV